MPELEEIPDELNNVPEYINSEKYMIFSIMNKYYSIPSKYISGISLFETVYPLPLMPSYVLGVINRYSVPYALFDIGLLFYNSPSPRNKVLIIKDEIDRIAFLIDDVTGIEDVPHDKLIILERSQETDELIDAVYASFTWNNSNVFVLDIRKILSRVTGESV
jgi:purine-binding chemotaxis protein CheW